MNCLNVSPNKRRIKGLFSLGALTLGISLGASSQVWAGAGVHDFLDTCTATNCGSQSISGIYIRDPSGRILPFTTQVYVHTGACVRLDVTSQDNDLEMVLVSPEGTVWRNDDRNGSADKLPLIKVNNPPSLNGWYTLHLSSYNGAGPVTIFTLRYGLYNIGNPNCSNPTPAM